MQHPITYWIRAAGSEWTGPHTLEQLREAWRTGAVDGQTWCCTSKAPDKPWQLHLMADQLAPTVVHPHALVAAAAQQRHDASVQRFTPGCAALIVAAIALATIDHWCGPHFEAISKSFDDHARTTVYQRNVRLRGERARELMPRTEAWAEEDGRATAERNNASGVGVAGPLMQAAARAGARERDIFEQRELYRIYEPAWIRAYEATIASGVRRVEHAPPPPPEPDRMSVDPIAFARALGKIDGRDSAKTLKDNRVPLTRDAGVTMGTTMGSLRDVPDGPAAKAYADGFASGFTGSK